MSKADRRMATVLTVCLVFFFLGAIGVMFSVSPFGRVIGMEALVLSIIMLGGSATLFIVSVLIGFGAKKAAMAKARSGPRKRIAAKIDRVWMTDRGHVVAPHETDLKRPGYHVVLMTPDGKTIECDTAAAVLQECIEGSWGWAEVQGDWLGGYVRDPVLFTQYSGR
jgi:hypothetical protein